MADGSSGWKTKVGPPGLRGWIARHERVSENSQSAAYVRSETNADFGNGLTGHLIRSGPSSPRRQVSSHPRAPPCAGYGRRQGFTRRLLGRLSREGSSNRASSGCTARQHTVAVESRPAARRIRTVILSASCSGDQQQFRPRWTSRRGSLFAADQRALLATDFMLPVTADILSTGPSARAFATVDLSTAASDRQPDGEAGRWARGLVAAVVAGSTSAAPAANHGPP
jgi:hypothetical protein